MILMLYPYDMCVNTLIVYDRIIHMDKNGCNCEMSFTCGCKEHICIVHSKIINPQ